MRLLLAALALALTLTYFTLGLRFGYVTLTPTYMIHATGESRYAFNTFEAKQAVGVRGSCEVRSGTVTILLFNPAGERVAGQVCPKGKWTVGVLGSGRPGRYEMVVTYKEFSGVLNVDEARE